MLMRPNDCAVDHRIFVIGVGGQMLEDLLSDASLGPAAEPSMGVFPVAKALGQITPGDAGAVPMEHGLDESAIVMGGRPDMADPSRQQVFDPLPLVVAQSIPGHGSAFAKADLPCFRQILAEIDSFYDPYCNFDSFYVWPCNN